MFFQEFEKKCQKNDPNEPSKSSQRGIFKGENESLNVCRKCLRHRTDALVSLKDAPGSPLPNALRFSTWKHHKQFLI